MDKLATGYGLIEGPVWHDERGLIFSDVFGGGVYAVTNDGDVSTVFEHRRGIGGMALHASGDGMVVSGRNIAFKPFNGGETVELLAQPPGESAGFNDLTTDSEGRIYAGQLAASPFSKESGTKPGVLWMIDLDGSTTVVGHDVMLTNGLGFSPARDLLYHSDSVRGAVMQYAVNDDGSLGPKELFVETATGAPDGLVVGEDGSVWVALAAGGGGVAVFNADGTHREHIAIDEPMCTSVCFGGPDMCDLYIVSGSEGLDTDRGGSVWRYRSEIAGLPVFEAKVPVEAK